MEAFGENLKRLRNARFLDAKKLAEATGLSLRTLYRWEAGQGEPGASELRILAQFFHISIDQLVEQDPPPKVSSLSGSMLDFWLAKVQGLPVELTADGPVMYEAGVGECAVPRFSSEMTLVEPLMLSRGVHLYSLRAGSVFDGETREVDGWIARCSAVPLAYWGASIPEAGARAVLASEIGSMILA